MHACIRTCRRWWPDSAQYCIALLPAWESMLTWAAHTTVLQRGGGGEGACP